MLSPHHRFAHRMKSFDPDNSSFVGHRLPLFSNLFTRRSTLLSAITRHDINIYFDQHAPSTSSTLGTRHTSSTPCRRLSMASDSSRPSPPTRLKSDRDVSSSTLSPDTEDNVVVQTDSVFRSFVYHMYVNDHHQEDLPAGVDDLPVLPDDLKQITDEPTMRHVQIGRQLALIGDDINDRYSTQFNRMIRALNPAPETAYEVFAGVARKLFHDGNINWGRVVTLLCFGYRLTVSVVQRGHGAFFVSIVRFVVQFVLVEKIAKWIADQGGWRAVMYYIPESIGWKTIGVIFSVSALSIAAAVFMARKQ